MVREMDTIAAVATAMGSSGIGIVRISGEESFQVLRKVFRKNRGGEWDEKDSHRVHYGFIYDGDEMIDEVLVLVMKGPHSYTAEDTVEIDCHGGILVMKRILETVIKNGARPAEPGEFTKRAFLNGRMDLSQAEAVMDLINAKNQYAMKSSISQLKGKVSEKVRDLRERILYEIAFIESALDDPEHISLEGYAGNLREKLEAMIKEVKKLIDSADNGRVMSEGVKTVIVGKPNAGKSSLMNVLAGTEKSIVTEIAGTTRDTLEEHIQLHGISLNVVDTAGIRETEDVVEKIGVSRARSAASEADLIIYVVDGSVPLDKNDQHIIDMIRDRKALVLLNKTDLDMVVEEEELRRKTGHRVIKASAKDETGMEELEEAVKSMFYEGEIDFNDQVYITNVRHKTALTDTYDSLMMVMRSINEGMPEDFFSIDLMNAYERLGTIIGEAVEDDLIHEIFGRFCMGK
ncbi:MAG: tRNA uridine-5-carboxymethylaminomethyl(34) synthesis GTPase MnmE [Hungatella sp.]|nr:tRNA uridine-5-carboxymethylaminomethyl(34) synthesis GTPase MnmE [Hungatella sp.]